MVTEARPSLDSDDHRGRRQVLTSCADVDTLVSSVCHLALSGMGRPGQAWW